jgi:hypothetical protein
VLFGIGWFSLQLTNGPSTGSGAIVQIGPRSGLGVLPASVGVPFFQQCPADPACPSFLHSKPDGQVPPVPQTKPPFLMLLVL